MFGRLLTPEERNFVEELRGNTSDKGAYMKLSVLILLDMDKDYDEIEAILGIVGVDRTVTAARNMNLMA
jgi:hypothetical protein